MRPGGIDWAPICSTSVRPNWISTNSRRSLGALDSLTYRTITNRAQLQHELADTRDRGWAASVEEEQPGVASIAAPVRDRGGYVVASIGISGDVERLCDHRARPLERLAELVVRAGRSVSREFGHGREL